jgi:hypothetical protein
MGNLELIGEFVQCLRIFGVKEDDALIVKGIKVLLDSETTDEGHGTGKWWDTTPAFYKESVYNIQTL